MQRRGRRAVAAVAPLPQVRHFVVSEMRARRRALFELRRRRIGSCLGGVMAWIKAIEAADASGALKDVYEQTVG
jgi:hypothetical protein